MVTFYSTREDDIFQLISVGEVVDKLLEDYDESEIVGKEYYSHDFKGVELSDYLDVKRVLSFADDDLYDDVGHENGFFDFFTETTKEAQDELKTFLKNWCDKYVKGEVYRPIGKLKTHIITEDDL